MIIKKKKLFLDADGCIVDTIGAIVSLYNEDFKYYKNYKYIHPHEINTWDFTELNCATPEYINVYFNQQRFFDRLELMPNAKKVLDELNKFYEINIVSMGYSPNLLGKSLYFKKEIPYAKFIGVNYKEYPDKSHIDMSEGAMFLDDSSKNLETSNCPNLVCFGDVYPWNEDWKEIRNFNWYEIYDYLMKI